MERKIIIAQNLENELSKQITDVLPDEWKVISKKEESNWQDHLSEAEILLGWNQEVESSVLDNGSNLKWIQSWSAGVDNYPLDKLAQKDVMLTSANGVHAYPISETIFALMLGLTRKIHAYVRNQNEKKWHHAGLKLELHNKTIGILGIGAIGKETARISKAFGMHVIGVRHSNKPEDYVDEMKTVNDLQEVLPECDYVVVTLPLTDETKGLFGQEQFRLMKDSSFFINIGRGEIVNEKELIRALEEQEIAGAGLDVFEKEPMDEDNPLWGMENVILTPHTAGSTEFYDKRLIEGIFLPNLKEYLKGTKPSKNLVNYQKGY